MSANTAIEWTDHTFNPWWGCTRVSAGCARCYAETIGHRFGVKWGDEAPRREAAEAQWKKPLAWNAAAKRAGRRARVFCASMADVFDAKAPEHAQSRLFDTIRATPWLDWQLLTKRPENIRKALPADWGEGYRNVWLGASVENQATADARIPLLLKVPAQIRFLSCEPLLGAVNLQATCTQACPNRGACELHRQSGHRIVQDSQDGGIWVECICSRLNGIDWVICGGESGRKSRGMKADWARSLRNQCAAAGVAFFFKQWGEWGPYNASRDPESELAKLENPKTFDFLRRHGKKDAGRLLDGREWNDFPQPAPAVSGSKE